MEYNPETDMRRYSAKIFGVVQGVGYRPYIYNQANLSNIKGWVSNQGSAVVMDIEGEKEDIKVFLLQIVKRPPELAVVEKVEVLPRHCTGYSNFQIRPSSADEDGLKFISTDVAVCPDCLHDILDPNNPRYRYAFTNCTACGPRYSIIMGLPYDRKNTTMDIFQMCPDCEREYNDPAHRRFHAQPNCCPTCGPTLSLLTNSGKYISCSDPVQKTIELMQEGKIVAIKGLGGFHLACDAQNSEAVQVLRERKNRPHKPFAIMVKDIDNARKLCLINEAEEKILLSNKRPIVLLGKKESGILSDGIAPNMRRLGIMLPYTPLHYLLFREGISCLVMTSGNRSSAPIQYDNLKAIKNLGSIADYFLIHNRDINIPVEDSVVKVVNNQEVVIRRARGYTPYVFPMKANHEILALGAEEKSSFCFAQNQYVYMSQYLGDLKDYDAYTAYEKAIKNLKSLFSFEPNIIAHDIHTAYSSNQYAVDHPIKRAPVQHHHAHMVSCMVEHNLFCPVIGIVFDGTGVGTDGRIWGGEFFAGTRDRVIRAGHFKYVKIQGGDQSIREPWRIAASYMHSINYESGNILSGVDEKSLCTVKQAMDKNLNCYETSSVGRFYDCVAALLNIRRRITYDAQAAIELESILDPCVEECYTFNIEEHDRIYQIDYKNILLGILKDIENGIPSSFISSKFHNTIGNAAVSLTVRIGEIYGIKNMVLSGGVFENNYLLLYMIKRLKELGFTVYFNQQIPTNDNGISVGQLAIADAMEGKG